MASKETATLGTVARDVREVKGLVQGQSKTLKEHSDAIKTLQEWKRGLDIAKQAVDEYKKQERDDKYQTTKTSAYRNLSEVLKYVVPLIVALMALIYAYTSRIH